MRKTLSIVLLAIIALCGVAQAATTVIQSNFKQGGFDVVRLTVTADGTGGAVADHEINLGFLTSSATRGPIYFYVIRTTPGTGAAAPDAYLLTIDDDTTDANGSICALTARSATLKEYADAAEDLPNYWPAVGNLYLDLGDIGAGNSTTIDLIFLQ
ncbi:MAG TPA: hypothetical protein DCZ95_12550 [Verrucomicrobia bacterium]|nr:hypothetical protein [Verrucomicrobiota bacterium]